MTYTKVLTALFIISMSTIGLGQNVGIGEPNPSEKLEVNGRIAAKGYKNTILSVEGNTQIVLSSSQVWTAVPGLTQTFTLDEATTIIASFGVNLQLQSTPITSPDASLALIIDGNRVAPCMNTISDFLGKAHFSNQYITELSSGIHTISVEYYIGGSGTFLSAPNLSTGNWERRLNILVFGSQ